jgi:hypothetical protein
MKGNRPIPYVLFFCTLFVLTHVFPRPLFASDLLGRPKICILVIDGLGADKISHHLTPFIWELIHSPHEKATYYQQAQAVMPSLTNPNHVSIITGVYPQAHGITSNYYWDRHSSKPSQPLSLSEHIETETLFTLIENEDPRLFAAGLFGKGKLAELFEASSSGQKNPDYLWQYGQYLFFGLLKPSWDKKTMGKVIEIISEKDPDLVFVNFAQVDLTSHFYGPDGEKAREAILTIDGQIKRLVNFLKDRGKWEKTVLIITADHGFQSVEPDPENNRPYTVINFGKELRKNGFNGVIPISNGGIELLYMRELDVKSDLLTPEQAKKLKDVRSLALQSPGIAEALYRLPNRKDGNEKFTLIKKYPQWRLNHMRTGEMFLIARPGYHFSDPFRRRRAALKGSHGGPDESVIPIIITGGYKELKDQIISTPRAASNPDLGATAAWLLALRQPRELNGSDISTGLRGRILSEAFK